MARKECCSVGVDIVEDSEKGTVSLLKRPNSPETVMLHNLCNIHNSASLLIAAACFGKQSSSNNSNVIEIYCYKLSCLAYKILADLSRGPIMVSIMLHDMAFLFSTYIFRRTRPNGPSDTLSSTQLQVMLLKLVQY